MKSAACRGFPRAAALLLALGCATTRPAVERDSQEERNKELVRRLYEETWNQGNVDVVDELLAEPWLRSDAGHAATPTSRETYKRGVRSMRAGLPDFHVTLEDVIAEGERVAFRFTSRGTHTAELFGVPPTGKSLAWTGISFVRIENGRVQEMWSSFDQYGLLKQLGLISDTSG